MRRMRMISKMMGMMWGNLKKILDKVILIRMEMEIKEK
jgi:hypothetical protein